MLISKQNIFELYKYFENAAADAPAYDPISNIFKGLFLSNLNCLS